MIDWDSCIKPVLGGPIASPTSGYTEQDLSKIVKAFNSHSAQVLQHDSTHECFYSSYVALVGHYIVNCFDKVPRHLFKDVTKACEVVLDFCLFRLQSFDVQCAVPQKNLMQLLSALTRGVSPFVRVDVITFTAMLRSAEIPPIVSKAGQAAVPQEKETDAINQMFEALEMYSSGPPITAEGQHVVTDVIIKENILSLTKLAKIHDFNKVYQSLQYLKRYFNRLSDLLNGKSMILPDSMTTATTVRNGLGPLSSNISIVLQAVSLPRFENLTVAKIENFCKLGLSCFYAALSVVSAMSMHSGKTFSATSSQTTAKNKEPDYYAIASNILEDVVNIHARIESTFESRGNSGQTAKKYRMRVAYVLARGLWSIMNQQNKDTSTHLFIVALAENLIAVVKSLLECTDFDDESEQILSEMDLKFDANLNTLTVFKECDVLQLLVRLISYKVEYGISALEKDETADSGASDDDNLEKYEDVTENEYSSSGEDSQDTLMDSHRKPLLGEWFLELLNQNNEAEPSDSINLSIPNDGSKMQFLLPDDAFVRKGDRSFLQRCASSHIVAEILNLFNVQLLSANSNRLRDFWKDNMNLESVVKLASLLKENGNWVSTGDLMSLMHKLLSSELSNDEIETAILTELGFDDVKNCLYADAKLLSVLFKILLRRQCVKRVNGRDCEKSTALLHGLVHHFGTSGFDESVPQHSNVLVIQMCLVLFHSLTGDGRSQFLHNVVSSLKQCDETGKIPRNTGWLALILEYVLLHCDEPCKSLLAQTQWNMIGKFLEPNAADTPDLKIIEGVAMTPFAFEKYVKKMDAKLTIVMPTGDAEDLETIDAEFFKVTDRSNLTSPEHSHEMLEILKNAGIDVFELYTVVIKILNSGSTRKMSSVDDRDMPSMIYTMSIGWRLLKLVSPFVSIANRPLSSMAGYLSTVHRFGEMACVTDSEKRDMRIKMMGVLSRVVTDMKPPTGNEDILAADLFPTHTAILVLDIILHEILNLFPEGTDTTEISEDMFPVLMRVTGYFGQVARSLALQNSRLPAENRQLVNTLMQLEFSGLGIKEMPLTDQIPELPREVLNEINKWKADRRQVLSCDVPNAENIFKAHLKGWNSDESYLTVLQFAVQSLHAVLSRINPWDSVVYSKEGSHEACRTLFSLPLDAIMNKFEDTKSMEYDDTSVMILHTLQYLAAHKIYDFIVQPQCEQETEERKFSVAFLKFLERLCCQEDTRGIAKVLHHFFLASKIAKRSSGKENPKDSKDGYAGLDLEFSGDFNRLLFAGADSAEYVNAYFGLLGAMLARSFGENADGCLADVVVELNQIVGKPEFIKWFAAFTEYTQNDSSGFPKSGISPAKFIRLLSHQDSPVGKAFCLKLLEMSIPDIARCIKNDSFVNFVTLLIPLAETDDGYGHLEIFKAALEGLETCKDEIAKIDNVSSPSQKDMCVIDASEWILFYITDVLLVLHGVKPEEQLDCSYDEDDDDIIQDDQTDTDSLEVSNPAEIETFTEDENLCDKLCTYTVTHKEFMNQHWYHCHTCMMTEGIGVCTVCAKVCHKNHDISYAKHGSFFCDCGAKGNKACKALTKRNRPVKSKGSFSATSLSTGVSSNAMRNSKAGALLNAAKSSVTKRLLKRTRLCKSVEGCKSELSLFFREQNNRILQLVLDVVAGLEKSLGGKEYHSMMPNRTAFAMRIVEKLHAEEKTVKMVDDLLVHSLGSQEGLFENVKANFTGEQGQTIRQLLNTKVISRVTMTCLSSGSGRPHCLTVSHEKSKLTVLQLADLLKPADSIRRNLTLTRLSTTQMPFGIVTLSNNPCNEGVLAVCGLKDCRVVTFNDNGAADKNFTVQLQEAAGNYIIKAVWLPGSATEIALVSAKCVTIYDLADGVSTPSSNLLIPTGKIRDATFAVVDDVTYLIIMSSSGYLYIETLLEGCSAQYGPFYLTSILLVNSDTLQEKNDELGGGGVSVYYSHNLQMLFFSYGNGRNFAATLDFASEDYEIVKLFVIDFKSSVAKSPNSASAALCKWSEIYDHPGLVTAAGHISGTPVAIMVQPDAVSLQEMKSPGKSRFQDAAVVRHDQLGDSGRSYVVVLSEDGALKIYNASQETTGFWLQPSLQPRSVFCRQPAGHYTRVPVDDTSASDPKPKEQRAEQAFPVDFFEDCQPVGQNDLAFGGDALLQVYNPEQIKNRLANQNTYLVSKKSFPVEITIKNKNVVVTGVRVQVGNHGADFAPTHVYIGDRYMSLGPRLKNPRWFDFPLTREESLRYRHKLVVTCGTSAHPQNYTIVDSIRVYGKTKEKFGWSEDEAKQVVEACEKSKTSVKNSNEEPDGSNRINKQSGYFLTLTTATDRIISACLHSLNSTFAHESKTVIGDEIKSRILELCGKLLVLNYQGNVSRQLKKLVTNVLPDVTDYHTFKDDTILSYVAKTLNAYRKSGKEAKYSDMHPDEFQSLLLDLCRVVVRRPGSLLSANVCLEWPPAERSGLEGRVYIGELWTILLDMMERKPVKPMVTPPCLPGIQDLRYTVRALVEVLHSTAMTVSGTTSGAAYIYYSLLTNDRTDVSSSAKAALLRLLCASEHVNRQTAGRTARSNSKTDSAPSTRSNSPPSANNQTVTTSANSASNIVMSSSQNIENVASHDDSLLEELREYGLLKEDDESGDSDGDEFDDDDDDDDEDGHNEEEVVVEVGGHDLVPSLNRDEQLRAMQALERNIESSMRQGASGNGNEASAGQTHPPQMQSEMRRLQEIMQSQENPSFFMQEDSSLEDMIIDGQEDEFAEFEGDDEAMVEYAIALSLQQSGGGASNTQASQSAQIGGNAAPRARRIEQLMNSVRPVSQQAAQNQESAQAQVSENTSENVSSRSESSKNESQDSGAPPVPARCPSRQPVFDANAIEKMRCEIVLNLLNQFPRVFELSTGQQSIPYFQVLVALTRLLDPAKETQRNLLENVVTQLAAVFNGAQEKEEFGDICSRSVYKEVATTVVRCLVLLMSDYEKEASAESSVDRSDTVASITARIMVEQNVIASCVALLDRMLECWDIGGGTAAVEQPESVKVLKKPQSKIVPDFTPLVLPQYVKSHPSDVFENYVVMMTERLLHVPYRFNKFYDSEKMPVPDSLKCLFTANPPKEGNLGWILSDYMLSTEIPVLKKRVRKALLYFCESKEKYRETRDVHALTRYMESVTDTWQEACVVSKFGTVNLPYDKLISIVKYLNASLAVAVKRTTNWQKAFIASDCSYLDLLLQMSIYIKEDIAASVLQLMMCAVSDKKKGKDKKKDSNPDQAASTKKAKFKDDGDPDLAIKLSVKFLEGVTETDLRAFLMRFLLEINNTSVRWDAHEFVLQLFRNTNDELRSKLITCMWTLWPSVSKYGRKSVQFVDLIGYLSIKNKNVAEFDSFIDNTLDLLKRQNVLLVNHPNSMLYMQLANYVDFDGYFLESNPCLICNQPEVPYQNIKLTSVKNEIKYTTTQQIIKLVGSYSLQKVTVKITDVKQTKMIRTATLLYNNKTVPAIVELKNKPELWHKAKQVALTQGQNEIRFDLPLPVVATNLMLEFNEFYENVSGTTETLQCPRCSASVQANPGICGNCGENVFQCHKCRSINYDEKDPYLCNVCGFSKYAKFDVSLLARPCCAVDAIENEDDRKKTVAAVSVLLEKADSIYYQMLAYKPDLEHLLLQIEKICGPTSGSRLSDGRVTGNALLGSRIPMLSGALGQAGNAPPGPNTIPMPQGSNVNTHIRQLAQKYCADAKRSFEELSKIMKTVLASRREIVEYDQRQKVSVAGGEEKVEIASADDGSTGSKKRCYGCASATAKQCVILLRALATDETARKRLVNNGLITELVSVGLRRGDASTRNQVQQLIGQLVRNDPQASDELNNIILSRITSGMLHYNQDLFPAAISSEMNLLMSILSLRDGCWQSRLRIVVRLFQLSIKMNSPAVTENVTLPCLQMLQSKSAASVPKTASKLIDVARTSGDVTVDAEQWLAGADDHDFYVWRENKIKCGVVHPAVDPAQATKTQMRENYLVEKYVGKWRKFVIDKKAGNVNLSRAVDSFMSNGWLRRMLFCKSSRAVRIAACSVVEIQAENNARKGHVIDTLTGYLDELSQAGDCAAEFFQTYQTLIREPHWKVRLARRGALRHIGDLIDREITALLKLEESSLSLDLQQGYALKELTELVTGLVRVRSVKQRYKSSLVGTVLNSYLSLRKLVIQRTTIVDDTQEMLLELLEDLTSGDEAETKAFMSVCIETIDKYELSDFRTPQFIFERLANIIVPEETNTNEFFMSLEKDPLQEDFLQGRMVGNPYSSNEPGLGPLMRDVKNKICRDCDLIALLEDDSGMELLVNNKIISLDLAVRDVHDKVWLPARGEDEAMRVVYRMRGLLGEATEDIIDKLDPEVDNRDEEEVFKMSGVLSECGGIESMLERLETVKNLAHGRQLVDAVLKLMTYAVHLKSNRKYFLRSGLNTLNILLGTLNLGLQSGEDGVPLVERLLAIMDRVLQETGDGAAQAFKGDKEKLTLLLQQIHSALVRRHSKVLRGIMKIAPFLSFGDPELMQMLIDHFRGALDFEKFDERRTDEDAVYLDCFCEICTGIENDENGAKLKRLIIDNNVVNDALLYVSRHIPQHKKFESDDWKAFLAQPALPYCLRLLAGLSASHPATQAIIGETAIPDLHRLEQVSTEASIGSLAENVLEALCDHPSMKGRVKAVRKETRAEKKRLAMAKRQKELGALGMKTNAKGQVVTETALLEEIGDLVEEAGLTCIICREGYKFEPKKALGVYTYTRRSVLDEYESKARKQHGYATVSHFNVVHFDCHTSAVRAARGREEWESAMLQNANTKCNGLLPIWGPHVPESVFATCLARHNTYIQEATGYKEPNVMSTAHDFKLLLLRFAQEKSFSEETGGGGPQSNVHLIPYVVHMAQYVINTTRSSQREERAITAFLEAPAEKWVESSYVADGPLYVAVLSVFVCDRERWLLNRKNILKRLLVLAHARHLSRTTISKLADVEVKTYDVYKYVLLFWSLIDLIYAVLFKGVAGTDATWSETLQNYIRNNDPVLQDTSERMVSMFQQEYLPVDSFEEFTDVAGLHDLVDGDFGKFISQLFEGLPK